MGGIITRNVSIEDASTDKPIVTVLAREGEYLRLEDFCRRYKVTPLQFLPVDAERWPGCFVGIFVPTTYMGKA